MTLSKETFVVIPEDHCSSLAAHFEYVVLLTTRGGNNRPRKVRVPDIARAHTEEAEIFFIPTDKYAGVFNWGIRGVTKEQNGHNAGYAGTALMLAVRPGLLEMERAEAGMNDPMFYAEERETISGSVHYPWDRVAVAEWHYGQSSMSDCRGGV